MKASVSSKGFTLLELLVVVAIVGLLSAIAIPIYRTYRARGFNARIQMDVRNAATAEEAYFINAQSYLTSGNCNPLLGMVVSAGVNCTLATGTGSPSYKVTATHPLASYGNCTYDSGALPHLGCS